MTTRDQALNRIRPDVRAMHAYAVQSAQGLLKLDAMENPFRLPPDLQQALGERLGALALNRYPGTRSDELKAALAQAAGMPAGCTMMLGNGSDELISLVTQAVAQPWDTAAQRPVVLAPVPGFVMYALSAQLLGLQFVGVPLTEDFELDLPAMLSAIEAHRPALTHIAYPNNPTATLWSEAAVQAVVDLAKTGGWATVALVAVNDAVDFWRGHGFEVKQTPEMAAKLASYGSDARYMTRSVQA